jgi:hypothetical protein
MAEGRWIPWLRHCARVERLGSWSFSEEEWLVWLGSAISCTELGTTTGAGFSGLRQWGFGVWGGLQLRPPLALGLGGDELISLRGAETAGPSTSLRSGRDDRISCYLARARTRVTSSGCSLVPIQSSTAAVTISVMRGSGKSRFSRNKSIRRCSPNSPKSFSGSVTPSV